MPNPFDPQNPARPGYFGGRTRVLQKVEERVGRAREQRQNGGILVHGYRGVGKTSLLNKIVSETREREGAPSNALVISRRLSRTTSDAELYALLGEELRASVRERQSVVERVREAAGAIRSVKVFEFAATFAEEEKTSPFLQWRILLGSLKNADFVLIALDDADYLSPEALSELKTIVEERTDTPLVLVVSGGPEFERRLVTDYSPVARVFSGASFNLTAFTLDETREVLEKPLEGHTRWSEDGVRAMQAHTAGYPYLVQCLASAAYEEDSVLDEKKVNAAVKEAVEAGRLWLDHEIEEASDQDVICFARIANARKTTLKSSEMVALGVSPPYIGRLVKLGVLRLVSRGRYSLEKSPMIAIYHMLKRGLSASPH